MLCMRVGSVVEGPLLCVCVWESQFFVVYVLTVLYVLQTMTMTWDDRLRDLATPLIDSTELR